MKPADVSPASVGAPVAVAFLEEAFRNVDLPGLSARDVEDVRLALERFVTPLAQVEDAFNSRFQDLLYVLIDGKADGLRDCTVTEIVNIAATAFAETEKDVAGI